MSPKNGDTARRLDWGSWRALGDPERREWGALGGTGALGGLRSVRPWEDAGSTGAASAAAAATGRGRRGAAGGLPSAPPGALQRDGLLLRRVSLAPPQSARRVPRRRPRLTAGSVVKGP